MEYNIVICGGIPSDYYCNEYNNAYKSLNKSIFLDVLCNTEISNILSPIRTFKFYNSTIYDIREYLLSSNEIIEEIEKIKLDRVICFYNSDFTKKYIKNFWKKKCRIDSKIISIVDVSKFDMSDLTQEKCETLLINALENKKNEWN